MLISRDAVAGSAVGALVGISVGLTVGHATLPSAATDHAEVATPVSRSSPQGDPNLPLILEELRKLQTAVSEFSGALSQAEAVQGADSEAPPNDEAITTRLEQIVTLLKSNRSLESTSRRRVPLELPEIGFRPRPLPELATKDELPALKREHLLLDYQRIVDRYGRPDQVNANQGGVTWFYFAADRSLAFDFVDGMLRDVRYTWKK